MKVASFSYRPGFNPYQRLFTESLEKAGLDVQRIGPEKWFPLQTANRAATGQGCEIVHMDWPHDWYSGKNLLTRNLKSWMYLSGLKSFQPKIVWTLHNLYSHNAANVDFEIKMIQSLIDKCAGIMVFSDHASNSLTETYEIGTTEIRKFYHGHYADCYPNDCSQKAAREHLKVASEKHLLVTVGSIKPYKGFENLIEKLVMSPRSNIKWIIAGRSGDQAYGRHLQCLVDNANQQACDIEFHNKLVPDNYLQYYFNAADACMLPFENILNSGSMLMAMSFGCPVIAPAMGSLPEIANPDWSFLYETDSPDSIYSALDNAIKKVSAHAVDEIRTAVISHTRKAYNWEQMGEGLKDWYHELLNRSPESQLESASAELAKNDK